MAFASYSPARVTLHPLPPIILRGTLWEKSGIIRLHMTGLGGLCEQTLEY